MAAVPFAWTQEEVGDDLPAISAGVGREVVIAAGRFGRDEVGLEPARDQGEIVAIETEGGLKERAPGEVVLVLRAELVRGLIDRGCGSLRVLGREPGMLIVKFIDVEAGSKDVAAGQVSLDLGEIAEASNDVFILVDGQLGDDLVLIGAIQGVEEPDLSFHDRTGQREAWVDLVECPSTFVLPGWNEVGGDEAIVVVADARFKHHGSPATLAELRGIAAGLHANGTKGVG